MKALVTGAAGFVGANLVAALAGAGHDVVAWVHPGGDAWRLEELGAPAQVDAVELLAA
jgi:nucleoside-diphosphate-sugar epimerase